VAMTNNPKKGPIPHPRQTLFQIDFSFPTVPHITLCTNRV
jgi:hypothetical protein